MKKLVLATAVAALSVTAAQAAPTVYGKAFLTLDATTGDYEERSALNSNASRIGVRGSEALTANTDVVYQLEYGVDVDADTNYRDDSSAKNQFYSRDTYLGLSNKQYGTLLAGRLSAIDGRVDYANVTQGGVMGGDNVLASFDSPRANNAFAYIAPTYNDVTVSAMYVMDENNGTDSLGRDAFGVAAQYEPTAPYRAGVSYIQAGDFNAVRVSGAYDLSPATTIGALYQATKDEENTTAFMDGTETESTFTLSAKHKVAQTPWTAYGQVDLVDNTTGVKDAETQRLVVGGQYAFNRATTGHIYAAGVREELNSVKEDGAGFGAGLEYKF